jgi:hypothetical protein
MYDGWIAALVQILQPYALSDQLALRFVETYKTFNNTSSDNEVDSASKCFTFGRFQCDSEPLWPRQTCSVSIASWK